MHLSFNRALQQASAAFEQHWSVAPGNGALFWLPSVRRTPDAEWLCWRWGLSSKCLLWPTLALVCCLSPSFLLRPDRHPGSLSAPRKLAALEMRRKKTAPMRSRRAGAARMPRIQRPAAYRGEGAILCQGTRAGSGFGAQHDAHVGLPNLVGDEGARQMSVALGRNSTLRTLKLDYNGIGPTGSSRPCCSARTEQQLSLCSNKIGAEGCRHLATALERNTVLTELRLDLNSLGADGCHHFAEATTAGLRVVATLQQPWSRTAHSECSILGATMSGLRVVATFQRLWRGMLLSGRSPCPTRTSGWTVATTLLQP